MGIRVVVDVDKPSEGEQTDAEHNRKSLPQRWNKGASSSQMDVHMTLSCIFLEGVLNTFDMLKFQKFVLKKKKEKENRHTDIETDTKNVLIFSNKFLGEEQKVF